MEQMIKMAVIKKNVPIKDSVTESIEFIEDEVNKPQEERKRDENSLPEAIAALCKGLFNDNTIKMGKISGQNKRGMTAIQVLNKYYFVTYGTRFEVLDDLAEDCMLRNISIDGFGIAALIEALKAIDMTIETNPNQGIVNKLLGRGGGLK